MNDCFSKPCVIAACDLANVRMLVIEKYQSHERHYDSCTTTPSKYQTPSRKNVSHQHDDNNSNNNNNNMIEYIAEHDDDVLLSSPENLTRLKSTDSVANTLTSSPTVTSPITPPKTPKHLTRPSTTSTPSSASSYGSIESSSSLENKIPQPIFSKILSFEFIHNTFGFSCIECYKGSLMIAGDRGGNLHFIDVRTCYVFQNHKFHKSDIMSIKIVNEHYLITTCWDGVINIFDLRMGIAETSRHQLAFPDDLINGGSLEQQGKSGLFFSPISTTTIPSINSSIFALDYCPQRQCCYVGLLNGRIYSLDFSNKFQLSELTTADRFVDPIYDMKVWDHYLFLATACGLTRLFLPHLTVALADCQQHDDQKSAPDSGKTSSKLGANFSVFDDILWCLALDPSRKMLCAGSFDGTVKLFSIPDCNVILTLDPCIGSVYSLLFADLDVDIETVNGEVKRLGLWIGGTSGRIKLFEMQSYTCVRSLGHKSSAIIMKMKYIQLPKASCITKLKSNLERKAFIDMNVMLQSD